MTPAAAERERCARLIELIAADWREAGAMQKVWASEYLARQIRDLADEQSAESSVMRQARLAAEEVATWSPERKAHAERIVNQGAYGQSPK